MKKLKLLSVALGIIALAVSAQAIPTLTVSDGATTVTVTDASGIVLYSNPNFDSGKWSVVITTAETKPAFGSATLPFMDLNIQATSIGGAPNLTITFSDTSYGPTVGSQIFTTQLSGHTIPTGAAGGIVTYNTFYSTANTIPAGTALTSSGNLAGPTYASIQGGNLNAASYSLSQVVTINGSAAAGYSLDASLNGSVPDGGLTVTLLGFALMGIEGLRRKLKQ